MLGANDRVNIAVIGIRSQGGAHIGGFPALPGVKLKTLCDIDENNFGKRVAEVEKKFGYKPDTAWDMRKVFDDKDIHAVTFATPNHWHALGSIWAAQAGKHVYVEKPACYGVWEGRQMVNAARKHKVLMQVGFQNRSRKNATAAIKFIQEGKLGKVYRARGLCFKPRAEHRPLPRRPDGRRRQADPHGEERRPVHGVVPGEGPLRQLDRAGRRQAVQPQPLPLQLALAVRIRRRRHRQPGAAPVRRGPLGSGKDDYPVRVRSTGGLFLYKD